MTQICLSAKEASSIIDALNDYGDSLYEQAHLASKNCDEDTADHIKKSIDEVDKVRDILIEKIGE